MAKARSYIPDILLGLVVVGGGAFMLAGTISNRSVASSTVMAPVIAPVSEIESNPAPAPGKWEARTEVSKAE